MVPFVKRILFGDNAGISRGEIKKMSHRHPFSQYLAYRSYDEETQTYDNQDDTIGWLWECSPLIFAGDKTVDTLEGLFQAGIPDQSVLSFTLFADPYLGDYLDVFEQIRVRQEPLVTHYATNLRKYLEGGVFGIENMARIPCRNFRLMVGLKIPANSKEAQGESWRDLRTQVAEVLAGAGLAIGSTAQPMSPERLLEWGRRLFNEQNGESVRAWDGNIPLRKQIINSETPIHDKGDHLVIGRRYFRCMTPKVNPREVDPLTINELFGGFQGLVSDGDQIKSPFLYTVNIVYSPLKKQLHAKCNFVLQQQAVGSLAPSLQRKQGEYLKATDNIERGVPYLRVMPIFWVWGRDEQEAMESISKAKRIWEARGFLMQVDRGILKIMFLAALPFGLFLNKGSTLDSLERDFVVDSLALSPTLPVQGDYRGAGLPKTVLFGRKGQVASLDFWADGNPNMNGLILAGSGGGKSFLNNDMVFANYSCGANIRILDVGRSYKKLVRMLGAKFLDFYPDQPISLNPFTNIVNPSEELSTVVDIMCLMAFSANPTQRVDTIEKNLMRSAVRWAWAKGGNKADTGLVYQFLSEFPRNPPPDVDESTSDNLPLQENEEKLRGYTIKILDSAKHLAFQIQEFTPQGDFGGFFSGPCVFDIRNDSCVVTELQELRAQPELYRVVTGLVVNAYLQDIYQKKDLTVPTFLAFDEGWQYLDEKQGGAGDLLAPVLERLARTARKQNAGMVLITQSILDLQNFGSAGKALWGNTATKIFMESNDLRTPGAQELLGYDDFTMRLLRSVKSQPPLYSEMFIDAPSGRGVARLARDPYNYYINTSNGKEVTEIEILIGKGLSYHEAILEMVSRRGGR